MRFTALALALLMPATAVAQLPVEPLHWFSAGPRGYSYLEYSDTVTPVSALTQAASGNFYGTTQYGGTFQLGTVFTVTPAGVATVLHSFTGADGALPASGLIQATDGNFYGTTLFGGAANGGTVFRMSPAGAVTLLYAFQGGTGGANPRGGLVQAADGHLYGTTTAGGPDAAGTAFRLTLTGSHTVIHAFSSGFSQPQNSLIQATDGNFYGTVFRTRCVYDVENCGGAFRMTPDGVFTFINSAIGLDNANPSGLVQGRDGNLYGVTKNGGTTSSGRVFRMTPSGSLTSLHSFAGAPSDGRSPEARLVEGADGNLYGTTHDGGASDLGAIFSITPAGGFTLLHSFTGGEADGAYPPAGLIQAADGNFYGATFQDGGAGLVTIFRMTPDGIVSPVSAFTTGGGTDGGLPATGLVQAADRSFYATTAYGGAHNNGAVLRIMPSGVTTVVHAFTRAESVGGYSALIEASDGNFYGTSNGGSLPGGTVFRMTPAGTLSTLHRFTDAEGYPVAALLQARDGNLYGTTRGGGPHRDGTVFRVTLDGAFSVLYAFTGSPNGSEPVGALIQATDGDLYGLTNYGSNTCCSGTAFRIAPDGGFTVLHRFINREGAFESGAGLIQAMDGYLHGVAAGGGANDRGTIFRMDTSGTVTVVYDFSGDPLTSATIHPAGLVQASDGTFYGTTYGASLGSGNGTVFQMTSAGVVTFLHTFSGGDGQSPRGPLVQGIDGNLYGTTQYGGAYDRGVVFRLNIRVPPPTPPGGVTVAPVSGAGVTLRWSGAILASSYNVKRSTASGGEVLLASGVTGTAFTDTSAIRGQHYYYIVTAVNEFGESVASYEVSVTAGQATVGDFTGDGIADAAVFRRSTGMWYVRGMAAVAWGGGADIPVAGDYDGDMRADVAVYRPSSGVWYFIQSSIGSGTAVTWGGGADIPVPGDYDGDGTTDVAVFRPSTGEWFILQSSTHTGRVVTWGGGADGPVARDFDGDAKTDIAVFRPSTGAWYILQSSTATGRVVMWGGGSDVPVAADYDGDGKADVAVFRPSTGAWYLLRSSTGVGSVTMLGVVTDVPVPADYDGDGKADLAVFRPSTGAWFINQSSAFTGRSISWGGGGDVPVLK